MSSINNGSEKVQTLGFKALVRQAELAQDCLCLPTFANVLGRGLVLHDAGAVFTVNTYNVTDESCDCAFMKDEKGEHPGLLCKHRIAYYLNKGVLTKGDVGKVLNSICHTYPKAASAIQANVKTAQEWERKAVEKAQRKEARLLKAQFKRHGEKGRVVENITRFYTLDSSKAIIRANAQKHGYSVSVFPVYMTDSELDVVARENKIHTTRS